MFTKLAHTHDLSPLAADMQQVIIQFGENINDKFFGYTAYAVTDATANKLLSYIPEQYHEYFQPALIEINIPTIPPHIDNAILNAINFYTDADGGITSFYSVKPNHTGNLFKLPNQTNGAIYDINDLDKYGEFIAKAGDIYVLDVTQIHDVKSNNGVRRAYSLRSFTIPYPQLVEILTHRNL